MRGAGRLAVGWLLSGALGLGAVAGAAEKVGVTRLSSNGNYGVRFTELDGGGCKLDAHRDTQVAWTLSGCVGTVDDVYLIADSGNRLWVLFTLPEEKAAPKGPPPADSGRRTRRAMTDRAPFSRVTVAKLMDRTGKVLQQKTLQDLIGPRGRDKVRQLGRHFKWLGGVSGVAGNSPRVNEHNQVELETIDLRKLQLDF